MLKNLLTQLQELDFLPRVMTMNMQRLSIFPNLEISSSHYLFYHDKVVNRLGVTLKIFQPKNDLR